MESAVRNPSLVRSISPLSSLLSTFIPVLNVTNLVLGFLSLCICSTHDLKWTVPIKCRLCSRKFCSRKCEEEHFTAKCASCDGERTCPENLCGLCQKVTCCSCAEECSSCSERFHEKCVNLRNKNFPKLDWSCDSLSILRIDTDCWHCGIKPKCQRMLWQCVICHKQRVHCQERQRKCPRCDVPLCCGFPEGYDNECVQRHVVDEGCIGSNRPPSKPDSVKVTKWKMQQLPFLKWLFEEDDRRFALSPYSRFS